MRDKVFISYSHKDKEWLDRLHVHLKPLMRDRQIDIWDDTRIQPGAKWHDEIKNGLQSAKVAVLLISPDFLASDFIVNEELPALLHAAEQDGAIILPVILRHSLFFTTPLASFQAVNNPSQPLSEFLDKSAEIDKVLVKLSFQIKDEFEKAHANVSMPTIQKSESSGGTKIWFSDFLHPDPVAVKLAVKAYKSGQRNFIIEWHPDNLRHLENLVKLFEQSKNYNNPDSIFRNVSVDEVLKFIDHVNEYVKPEYCQLNTSKREKRIPFLLEGILNYFPYNDTSYVEESLTNYLVWANFHLFHGPFYWLGHIEFRKLGLYPEEWLPFHLTTEGNAYPALFGVNEQFYYARLYELADVLIETYFSPKDYIYINAPKSMMIDAICWLSEFNFNYGYEPLLFKYVIPQVEWELSELFESKVVKYGWETTFMSDLSTHKGYYISEARTDAEWLYSHNRKRYYEARQEGRFSKDDLAEDDKLTDEEVEETYGSDDIWDSDDE